MSINDSEAVPPVVGGDVVSSAKLAEIWQNLLPYADLNAKGIPERFLTLGQDILPTLAILAASGNKNPRLLNADAAGRLIATANPLVADTLLGAIAAGDSTCQVSTAGNYAPGMLFMVIASAGGGTRWEVRRVLAVNPGAQGATVFVDVRFQQAYQPGDAILILMDPLHDGFLPVERPYDWELFADPGAGVAATATQAGTPGFITVVDAIEATFWGNNAATAQASRLSIDDDPAGANNHKWRRIANIGGPNFVDVTNRKGLNIRGTVGKDMKISFDAGPANVSEIIVAKGWLESPGGSHGTIATRNVI